MRLEGLPEDALDIVFNLLLAWRPWCALRPPAQRLRQQPIRSLGLHPKLGQSLAPEGQENREGGPPTSLVQVSVWPCIAKA